MMVGKLDFHMKKMSRSLFWVCLFFFNWQIFEGILHLKLSLNPLYYFNLEPCHALIATAYSITSL